MSTHNIQFHDKIRKKSLNICFLELLKNFVGTEKRVRIIHCKRAIHVRAIEVILYIENIVEKRRYCSSSFPQYFSR